MIRCCIAGLFLGIGIGCGFIPIAIASIIMRENLYLEIFDRMDAYWVEKILDIEE